MVHLASQSKEAYFVGDAFHHPLEMWMPGIDDHTSENPALTTQTRRNIIDCCSSKGALCIPAHFPDPFGGYLTKNADGGATYQAFVCTPEPAE